MASKPYVQVSSTMTPLCTVASGLAAGALGTLAIDAPWFARYPRGGDRRLGGWEFSSGLGLGTCARSAAGRHAADRGPLPDPASAPTYPAGLQHHAPGLWDAPEDGVRHRRGVAEAATHLVRAIRRGRWGWVYGLGTATASRLVSASKGGI